MGDILPTAERQARHLTVLEPAQQRKAGELLAALAEQSKGGDRRSSKFQAGILKDDEYTTVLTENDIAQTTAHRWQTVGTGQARPTH